jgi:ABC-type uncharacterized transport system substrate-binding protein
MMPLRNRHARTAVRAGARYLLLALALLGIPALALARAPSAPTETVIVLSSDAAPYKAAETSLRHELASTHTSVRTVLLNELTAPDLESLSRQATGSIIAIGSDAAASLHTRLPQSAPLLYCMAADPAGSGLTSGRTTPGVCTDVPAARQAELLMKGMPATRTIATLYRASVPASAAMVDAMKKALPSGVELKPVDLDKHEHVAAAVDTLLALKPDLIWTGADPSTYNTGTIKALLKDALGAGVPVFGFSTQFVRAGAIFGVGVRPEDQGEQAGAIARGFIVDAAVAAREATAADRIRPPKVRIAVNTIVAKRLNISLPQSLVGSADDVFAD